MLPGTPTTDASLIGMSAAAIVWAVFYFRRKVSRDGTEIIKDRVEGKLLEDLHRDRETLLGDRDEARESERAAWQKASDFAVLNASLSATVEYQQKEIDRLTALVGDLQGTLDEVKRRLQHLSAGATGHTGMGHLK